MFTSTNYIIAIPISSLPLFDEVVQEYGELLDVTPNSNDNTQIKTLAGFKDRRGSQELRAAELGVTIIGTPLINDRLAFIARFTQGFVNAIGVDPRSEGISILTQEELDTQLLPLVTQDEI